MENGGINKEDKTKAEKNAESDVETAVLEKIKEYTVDDGGLPAEAESTYLQLMAELRAAYGHQVDMPVSLDKYSTNLSAKMSSIRGMATRSFLAS